MKYHFKNYSFIILLLLALSSCKSRQHEADQLKEDLMAKINLLNEEMKVQTLERIEFQSQYPDDISSKIKENFDRMVEENPLHSLDEIEIKELEKRYFTEEQLDYKTKIKQYSYDRSQMDKLLSLNEKYRKLTETPTQ